MSARDLSSLIRAVAGMPSRPPTPWIKAYMSAAADSLDDFDAPGHALLAHSLGRLRCESLCVVFTTMLITMVLPHLTGLVSGYMSSEEQCV